MAGLIKQEGEYSIVKVDKWYAVAKGKEVLKTPGGKGAFTMYLPIAEQLLKDWKEQGYASYETPFSLLCFHFSMVENFARLSKEEVLDELNSMNWENTWVFQGCPSANPEIWMKWVTYFGNGDPKIDLVREWLNNQTIMQLAASACVFNAFMDFNVPYYMAVVVEDYPEEDHDKLIREFYDFYSLFDDYLDYEDFWKIFERFRLYYGIHFKEDGPHLPQDLAVKEE